jgi:hypothetical protein
MPFYMWPTGGPTGPCSRCRDDYVDVDLVNEYCLGESAVIHEKGDYLIFDFNSETGDFDWEDTEGWLASLISLREDILGGDYRSLYLAWLYCVQMHEMDNEEPQPPVPPNLADLNATLKSFVDFMRIDTDLIAVAADNSLSESRQTEPEALRTWIRNLPAGEKDEILFRLVVETSKTAASMSPSISSIILLRINTVRSIPFGGSGPSVFSSKPAVDT